MVSLATLLTISALKSNSALNQTNGIMISGLISTPAFLSSHAAEMTALHCISAISG